MKMLLKMWGLRLKSFHSLLSVFVVLNLIFSVPVLAETCPCWNEELLEQYFKGKALVCQGGGENPWQLLYHIEKDMEKGIKEDFVIATVSGGSYSWCQTDGQNITPSREGKEDGGTMAEACLGMLKKYCPKFGVIDKKR